LLKEGAVDVQEISKLDAYFRRMFGNPRIRVIPKGNDAANVFVGDENIGSLSLDDDDDDDERSYNFEMKITLADASPKAPPDIKKLDTHLKRKFGNDRIRVVPRAKKRDSVEVYIDDNLIGVLFFDDKDARSSYLELPILALDLDEPDLLQT
jgi:hypothetical protein